MNFALYAIIDERCTKIFFKKLNEINNYNLSFDGGEEMKWYAYREQLIEATKSFKDIKLLVLRWGEMRDFNCHLFHNGKCIDLIPPEYVSEETRDFEHLYEIHI